MKGAAERIYEKLKDAPPDLLREVQDFIGYLESKQGAPSRPRCSLQDFSGSLKGSSALSGDAVTLQRKLRDEWD